MNKFIKIIIISTFFAGFASADFSAAVATANATMTGALQKNQYAGQYYSWAKYYIAVNNKTAASTSFLYAKDYAGRARYDAYNAGLQFINAGASVGVNMSGNAQSAFDLAVHSDGISKAADEGLGGLRNGCITLCPAIE